MKKHSNGILTGRMAVQTKAAPKEKPGKEKPGNERFTIGMDLGDRTSCYCLRNSAGDTVSEGKVATTREGLEKAFGSLPASRIAIEAGTHSPWVSRLLQTFGHEVLVANPRQVQLISKSTRKDDKMDARFLARLAHAGPDLLHPIQHRSEQSQTDKLAIQIRATLIEVRTELVNSVRGLVKAFGYRIPACDAGYFTLAQLAHLPQPMQDRVRPLLENIETLSRQITTADKEIEQIAEQRYPETKLLTQVYGVGTLIALTYMLTVDDPARFQRSRDAGCYLGLRPKRRDSGAAQPQLGITKEGDRYLRSLLVQAAHCLSQRRAPDSNLKRWCQKLSGPGGGKNARKRALVAVARKLAVLLHRLWTTGEVYEPLYQAPAAKPQRAA